MDNIKVKFSIKLQNIMWTLVTVSNLFWVLWYYNMSHGGTNSTDKMGCCKRIVFPLAQGSELQYTCTQYPKCHQFSSKRTDWLISLIISRVANFTSLLHIENSTPVTNMYEVFSEFSISKLNLSASQKWPNALTMKRIEPNKDVIKKYTQSFFTLTCVGIENRQIYHLAVISNHHIFSTVADSTFRFVDVTVSPEYNSCSQVYCKLVKCENQTRWWFRITGWYTDTDPGSADLRTVYMSEQLTT